MKDKVLKVVAVFCYILFLAIFLYYIKMEFNKMVNLTLTGRILLLGSCCLLVYFGTFLLSKNLNERNREKIIKANLCSIFSLYLVLLCTLVLFDQSFGRYGFDLTVWNSEVLDRYLNNSVNIIPFKTIIGYLTGFISGDTSIKVFIINVVGNIIAFMPFSLFLPLIFPKINNTKKITIVMFIIIAIIELLQFITISGSCDIDDIILNITGVIIMYKILNIRIISHFIKKVFLFNKVNNNLVTFNVN